MWFRLYPTVINDFIYRAGNFVNPQTYKTLDEITFNRGNQFNIEQVKARKTEAISINNAAAKSINLILFLLKFS